MKDDDFINIFNDLSGGEIMLKNDIFLQIIKSIPDPKLSEIIDKIHLTPPNIGDMDFHLWIKKARTILDLTQDDVAVGVGIRQEELSKIEKGKISLSPNRRKKLLEYFNQKISNRFQSAA